MHIKIEDEYGKKMSLSGDKDINILSVTGLTPPTAAIYTHTLSASDGNKYNGSRANSRNIVLTLAPVNSPERARLKIYSMFKSKKYIKIYFTTSSREVYAEGYVESIDGNLYENPQKIQISIICPYPYFKKATDVVTEFTTVNSYFEFPFAIEEEGIEFSESISLVEKTLFNDGDNDTGFIIELEAVEGKVLEPTIYNRSTRETFSFKADMEIGDKIIINSHTGEKSLKLIRGGIETNIINNIYIGSKWLTLQPGENIFTYTCAEGVDNLYVTFKTNVAYGGL